MRIYLAETPSLPPRLSSACSSAVRGLRSQGSNPARLTSSLHYPREQKCSPSIQVLHRLSRLCRAQDETKAAGDASAQVRAETTRTWTIDARPDYRACQCQRHPLRLEIALRTPCEATLVSSRGTRRRPPSLPASPADGVPGPSLAGLCRPYLSRATTSTRTQTPALRMESHAQ